jgi:chromosome segregation ATPase
MTPSALKEKEASKEHHSVAPGSVTAGETDQAIISEIKGLEILKEGTYAVDLENTISDMLDVIKRMEAQLESVLNLNAKLESDLDASKGLIVDLHSEKTHLEEKISRMEEEMPSNRELLLEIDELTEERNDAQATIHAMKSKIERLQAEIHKNLKQIGRLKEDKQDIILEMDYVEAKLNAALKKNHDNRNEMDALRGERLTLIEKRRFLESELIETNKEKFRLFQELKDV